MVLDVFGSNTAPNTKVITYIYTSNNNQLWMKQPASGDSFYLVPKIAPRLKLAIVDNQVVINETGTKLRTESFGDWKQYVMIQSVESGLALEAGGIDVQVAAKPKADGSDKQKQIFVFYNV